MIFAPAYPVLHGDGPAEQELKMFYGCSDGPHSDCPGPGRYHTNVP
jgi:hypothetical protein